MKRFRTTARQLMRHWPLTNFRHCVAFSFITTPHMTIFQVCSRVGFWRFVNGESPLYLIVDNQLTLVQIVDSCVLGYFLTLDPVHPLAANSLPHYCYTTYLRFVIVYVSSLVQRCPIVYGFLYRLVYNACKISVSC